MWIESQNYLGFLQNNQRTILDEFFVCAHGYETVVVDLAALVEIIV